MNLTYASLTLLPSEEQDRLNFVDGHLVQIINPFILVNVNLTQIKYTVIYIDKLIANTTSNFSSCLKRKLEVGWALGKCAKITTDRQTRR